MFFLSFPLFRGEGSSSLSPCLGVMVHLFFLSFPLFRGEGPLVLPLFPLFRGEGPLVLPLVSLV